MKKADRIELSRLVKAGKAEIAKREQEQAQAAEDTEAASEAQRQEWIKAAQEVLPPYLRDFVSTAVPSGYVFVTIPGVSQFAVSVAAKYGPDGSRAGWKAANYAVFQPVVPEDWLAYYPNQEYAVGRRLLEVFKLDQLELAVGAGVEALKEWEAAQAKFADWLARKKVEYAQRELDGAANARLVDKLYKPVVTAEDVKTALDASAEAVREAAHWHGGDQNLNTMAHFQALHAQAVATAWLASIQVNSFREGGPRNDYYGD